MRTRTTRLLTALTAAALVVALPGPAQARAASDPPVMVAPGSTLTITGHGWGHGHGMSQYGARGAALAGLTSAQILAFYYPGTALAPLSASIKVLITGDTDNNTTVLPERGLRVRDLGNGRTYKLRTPHTPKVWRLVQVNGHTKVFYKTSRWHLYKTGGRRSLAGDGELRSATGLLTLRLPTGDRVYRGALRNANRDTVNVLSIENYLKGVIASEMPASWPAAALQAQAVAARTYAARERADNLGDYYQICDTSACQVYRGVAGEQPQSNAAAAATAGQVLTYGGQYAFAQFASSNGGWSSSGGQPYLVPQPDPYAAGAGDPNLNWTKQVTVAAIQAAYPTVGQLTSIQIMTRDGNATYPNDGWVTSIVLTGNGSTPTKTISGSDLKSLFGLKSAYFTLSTP